jgi:hypothetical protein
MSKSPTEIILSMGKNFYSLSVAQFSALVNRVWRLEKIRWMTAFRLLLPFVIFCCKIDGKAMDKR